MQQQFLKKFFPSYRTNSFKRQITTFTQKPGETFYKCWDRYKDLLNTCPHHGFEIWRLVSQFYEGLTPKDKQMVELMCNETFEHKDPDEAMEYLDLLAENAQNWNTTGTCEALGKTQPHTSNGVMYNLKENHDLHLKYASLAKKVEALELKKNGQLKSVQEIVCQICETNEHSTNDCPTLPSFNHLNFSWKSGNNNAQTSQPPFQAHHNFQNSHGYASPYVPPPGRNLEDTLYAFIEKQETINIQLAQSMTDFKDTLAKFISALSFQEKGKFSSQPQQNPKGQYNSSASSSGSQHMDQVQSIITLHSGKVIEKPILKPCEKDDESISNGKEGVKPEHCKEKTDSPPILPFPHAMTKQREVNHDSEIFETFKQEGIKDEKGTENVVADHLSRLTTNSRSDITPINDYFPDESLLCISTMPWFANIDNFLTSGFLPAHLDTQDKIKFLSDMQKFYWDDPYLFKYCPDQIFQKYIPDNEVCSVIKFYHFEAYEDHFSSKKTIAKILQCGFYWPTMFKDSHAFCKTSENYQKVGFISKHRESLYNLLLTLKSHHSGDMYRAIHDLWPHFHKEHDRLSLGNLIKKDHVCQFLRKLDGKPIPDP